MRKYRIKIPVHSICSFAYFRLVLRSMQYRLLKSFVLSLALMNITLSAWNLQNSYANPAETTTPSISLSPAIRATQRLNSIMNHLLPDTRPCQRTQIGLSLKVSGIREAILRGDLNYIKEHFDEVKINDQVLHPDSRIYFGHKKQSLLHLAAHAGKPEVIAFLLKKGANPHLMNAQGATPIDIALAMRNEQAVQLFQKMTAALKSE
jgi:hypothetical protein